MTCSKNLLPEVTLMLEDADKEWIDARYVHKDDCDRVVDHQNRKFANDDKRLAVIETYQKLTLAVMGAIGVGVLGLVLNQFWGM